MDVIFVGRNWFFVVLEGREYAVSDAFVATQEDIFQIAGILQAVKRYVQKRVTEIQEWSSQETNARNSPPKEGNNNIFIINNQDNGT